MSDLSDDARSLLTRAKRAQAVSPAALARVRRNVMTKVAITTAAGAAGTTVASQAKAAPALLGLFGAKAVGVLALVGTVAAGGFALERRYEAHHGKAAPSVSSVPTTSLARGVDESPSASSSASSSDPVPAAPVPALAEHAPSHDAVRRMPALPTTASAEPIAVSEVSLPASEKRLLEEAEWAADVSSLRAAQAALLAGNFQGARALAERVSGVGPFREERDALMAIADCRSARAANDVASSGALAQTLQRASVSFANAHAGSPLVGRVASACTVEEASKP